MTEGHKGLASRGIAYRLREAKYELRICDTCRKKILCRVALSKYASAKACKVVLCKHCLVKKYQVQLKLPTPCSQQLLDIIYSELEPQPKQYDNLSKPNNPNNLN